MLIFVNVGVVTTNSSDEVATNIGVVTDFNVSFDVVVVYVLRLWTGG